MGRGGRELKPGSLRDPSDGNVLNLDCGGYMSVQVTQLLGTKYRHEEFLWNWCSLNEV